MVQEQELIPLLIQKITYSINITTKSSNCAKVSDPIYFKFYIDNFRWNSNGTLRTERKCSGLLISRLVWKRTPPPVKSSWCSRCGRSFRQQKGFTHCSLIVPQHGYVLPKIRLTRRMCSLSRNHFGSPRHRLC